MYNILLVCNQGMSTSFLVEKMKQAAQEKEKDVTIWAVSDAELNENWEKADIVLLGPQVSYLKSTAEKAVGNSIPIEVIDFLDYGRVNGEAVLDKALKSINKD
ncbi:PTS sugar transporter subunit IIB [Oceanobacillus neutriphilus]|uniref:PTS sugar transporter subunit IIB n=1 Tax=Oceanobacillus neutriphilus TaxID=531815 RepID=A0ABQ2NNI6_9BACI|nr:PTS sugar transporter subunit IIB [Oceanobacillus neutriphilus]GGP07845.1 PTS sugar transporter subunit IIB [Oceanobacillus neutriphilus]